MKGEFSSSKDRLGNLTTTKITGPVSNHSLYLTQNFSYVPSFTQYPGGLKRVFCPPPSLLPHFYSCNTHAQLQQTNLCMCGGFVLLLLYIVARCVYSMSVLRTSNYYFLYLLFHTLTHMCTTISHVVVHSFSD